MITYQRLTELQARDRIASVRVVPVPLTDQWCIDVLIRQPLEPGSTSHTIAKATADAPQKRLQRFDSLDQAAAFLHRSQVASFTVDTDDSLGFIADDKHVLDHERERNRKLKAGSSTATAA